MQLYYGTREEKLNAKAQLKLCMFIPQFVVELLFEESQIVSLVLHVKQFSPVVMYVIQETH